MSNAPSMLAAVYKEGQISVREVPRPQPGPGEVLLEVEGATLCATDIKIWRRGHRNIPAGSEAILGHEVVGRVVEVGEGVKAGLIGTRVVVPPNVGCGLCPACLRGWDSFCPEYKAYGVGLPGALAEYMLLTAPGVSRGGLIEVPEEVPVKVAVLAEATSCCYRGLRECAVEAGDSVLVMGAGPMGVLSMIAAAAMGASQVIAADPLEKRREMSLNFADYALDPSADDFLDQVREITRGEGVDVAMVTAPSTAAQRQAIEAAAIGGRINLFAGLAPDDAFQGFPANLVHYRGLKVLGTTGTTPWEMKKVVALMAGKKLPNIDRVVTAVFPLARADEAFQEASKGEGLKVMLLPKK